MYNKQIGVKFYYFIHSIMERIDFNMAYINYNANPVNKNTGDCTVRAISVLMNQSWEDTYTDLSMVGYYLHDMPSSNQVWGEYLYLNGYYKNIIPDVCPACYTIKEFCRDHPHGSYLVATGSHVVAVINGDYIDTWDSGYEIPIYYYVKGERDHGRK